ncbi:MAG: glycosyltransferase family 9 protein [Kiritimatiellae bacterium]|nr:glycosyltransferase family 9 protein [Kiritimatiellia bacterium]
MPTVQQKVLVIELWKIGDAVIMSSFLNALRDKDCAVTVLGQPFLKDLLGPSYPEVRFVPLAVPWTAFRGKYRLWRWPWVTLIRAISTLRREHFDVAVSVRPDPRDHLMMWFTGAKQRCGFTRNGWGLFLTTAHNADGTLTHRVADWQILADGFAGNVSKATPHLDGAAYSAHLPEALRAISTPLVLLHVGAGQAVRRWPLAHWRTLLEALRKRYQFHLIIMPDGDAFGTDLRSIADTWLDGLSLPALLATLSRADLFLGNDSGPGHAAAALGTPAVAVFGPQRYECFAPFGEQSLAVSRDLCRYRPCRDYCKFAEPICLTTLLPEIVLPDIVAHCDKLVENGTLPTSFRIE